MASGIGPSTTWPWGSQLAAKEGYVTGLTHIVPKSSGDYPGIIAELAGSGKYSLIICNGFESVSALREVAPRFPEQRFVLIDAEVDLTNVASVRFNDWELGFLGGVVAGFLTHTGKIGFLGGMKIPVIKEHLAAYIRGARWANPKIGEEDVLAAFVGSWRDPERAAELAGEMYAVGADIVYAAAGKSNLGPFAAAQRAGGRVIGEDVDQAWTLLQYADVIAASFLKRVDLAVYGEIVKAAEGTWTPGTIRYGMSAGTRLGTGMAIGTQDIPPYIKASRSEAEVPVEAVFKVVEAIFKTLNGDISPLAQRRRKDNGPGSQRVVPGVPAALPPGRFHV